jgi:hypothetical protein
MRRVLLIALLLPWTALAQQTFPPADIDYSDATIMSEGVRMHAERFSAKDNAGKKLPTILMAHGWGGTAGSLRRDAVVFARAGYFVVTFDYRGWGESDSRVILTAKAPAKIAGGRFSAEVQEVREVVDPLDQGVDWLNALHWLQGESQCDTERIGIWGSSFSGGHVVWVAARDPRVKVFVSQVGSMDSRWVVNTERERKKTYAEAVARARGELGYPDPSVKAVGNLRGAPIREKFIWHVPVEDIGKVDHVAKLFIIAGDEELFDNRDHAINAYEQAGGVKKLVSIPGITHYGVYRDKREQVQRLAVEWFDKYLK